MPYTRIPNNKLVQIGQEKGSVLRFSFRQIIYKRYDTILGYKLRQHEM